MSIAILYIKKERINESRDMVGRGLSLVLYR